MLADTGLKSIGAIRDHRGQALAYVYFEDEPGRRRLRHDAGPALRPGESVLHRSMGLATLA